MHYREDIISIKILKSLPGHIKITFAKLVQDREKDWNQAKKVVTCQSPKAEVLQTVKDEKSP